MPAIPKFKNSAPGPDHARLRVFCHAWQREMGLAKNAVYQKYWDRMFFDRVIKKNKKVDIFWDTVRLLCTVHLGPSSSRQLIVSEGRSVVLPWPCSVAQYSIDRPGFCKCLCVAGRSICYGVDQLDVQTPYTRHLIVSEWLKSQPFH